MKQFGIICFLLVTIGTMKSQDIHFSQFYQSPLNLNPALTGVMNETQRFVINYRNQWAPALGSNAYNTYSASFDRKFAAGERDYFGLGVSLWGDVAGESRFGTNQARLSASFSKFISGNRKRANYLVAGTDAGITQRRIRTNDLRWPNQHDGAGKHDASIDPLENFANDNIVYPDISAGVMWFSVLDESNSFYVGAAAHHINKPSVSFINQNVSLYTRLTVHAGGEFAISKGLSLLPGAIVMFQGPHREYNGGTSVRFKVNQNYDDYFQIGLWTRLGTNNEGSLHSDALIFSTRFETGNYGIGLSYDMTTSEFRQAGTANGSFELSMSYLIKGPERRPIYCPRF